MVNKIHPKAVFFAILPTFGTFYNFMATNLASFPLSNMVGLVGIEWG